MYGCLIPPKGQDSRMSIGKGVLALAPQILEDNVYSKNVATLGLGRFLIVDNGAAEHVDITPLSLDTAARRVGAQEVVLPDELGDADETYKKATAYLREYPQTVGMAPVQGKSLNELQKLVDAFASIPQIKTLGIPRLLMGVPGLNRSIRIDLANWIHLRYYSRFAIHLLGTNPLWCSEVKAAAKYAPHIRSCDTSAPYNYALAGRPLNDGLAKPVHRRPDYLKTDRRQLSAEVLKLVTYNETVFLAWCDGNDIPPFTK